MQRDASLTEFLLARIAEDEAAARATWAHPTRILAECQAKRRIVEIYDVCPGKPKKGGAKGLLYYALCCHAEIYADHPDYREEWRV